MARYNESACKICRNEGLKLFLKGQRCDTPKCAFERRSYRSGPHGQARKKLSEYATQLREKQKVKRSYGLLEKQFRRNFDTASHKKGVTGTLMFQGLEARLDNIVYRSGLVSSRAQGRQFIGHGHFLVNGRKVDVSSFRVKPGDVITVRQKSKSLFTALQEGRKPVVPQWIEVDDKELKVRLTQLPEREEIDQSFKEQMIIELYSK